MTDRAAADPPSRHSTLRRSLTAPREAFCVAWAVDACVVQYYVSGWSTGDLERRPPVSESIQAPGRLSEDERWSTRDSHRSVRDERSSCRREDLLLVAFQTERQPRL